jgi:hypothetical protein
LPPDRLKKTKLVPTHASRNVQADAGSWERSSVREKMLLRATV